jgi:hypothetical protein
LMDALAALPDEGQLNQEHPTGKKRILEVD